MSGKSKSVGVVEEIVEKIRNLGENEAKPMKVSTELPSEFRAEIGYFARNERGSYQIRVRYGITTLMKIRNKDDFEAIKKVIEYLEKNQHYIEAIEKLNGNGRRRRIVEDVEYI